MALHFSCNQYQQAFDPRRLQNWNVPHKYRKHPVAYEGFTKIIASDRGHLLPAVPRSTRSPWGTFVGTWDLPRQIPGNKLTDPTARRTEEYYKNLERRSSGQAVILGRLKVRRAQAGAYEDIAQPTEEIRSEARSQRSGAANPLAKPQDLGTESSTQIAASGVQPPKAMSPTGFVKPPSPLHATSETNKQVTPHPQSPGARQASRLSKEPMITPVQREAAVGLDVSHSPKPPTPFAAGEPRLYSPNVGTMKAFSPLL